ncbi:MAG: hypothetical protein B7Z10_00665 [Rhodobacterales bacterium 32-66-7]|nr:MAG: hypothetical protein B7Z31_10445 [Rhodobacterales bacterium 12-65-15]OYX27322.1 MAG: hypothetical protein B7Z10_00665 [Rhodobacterales bacterium 32-66-7]
MAIDLIASLFVAATAGLLVWVLLRWMPSLPRWLVPVSAGVALIAYTVWSEYDWYPRLSRQLPPEIEVVATLETASPFRPWTYLAPSITSFVALDHRKTLSHPQKADLRMVTLYSFARSGGMTEGLMAVDCAANRYAMIVAGSEITEAGDLTGAEWQPAKAEDRFQQAACKEG